MISNNISNNSQQNQMTANSSLQSNNKSNNSNQQFMMSNNKTVNNNSINGNTDMINKVTETSSTGLLDLLMCKMVAPFHIVNDPRLLECGSSACYQCIVSNRDQDKNLRCPYCNCVHKINDPNKLLVNKNLNQFLKFNFKQINQSVSKQLEDSMFLLEQKISAQNVSMENFDQYLTLIQNDIQTKVEMVKSQLEKYADQFIENIKLIRKEVQKKFQASSKEYESRFNVYRQWIEQNGSANSMLTSSIANSSNNAINMINNNNANTNFITNGNNNLVNNNVSQLATGVNLLNSDTFATLSGLQIDNANNFAKDKTLQVIGFKTDSILPTNLNVLTVLNATNGMSMGGFHNGNHNFHSTASSYPLNNNNLITDNQNNSNNNNNSDKQRNNLNNNNNKSNNIIQQNGNNNNNENLTNTLDTIQNNFNFSNSSSWNANDDDLDEFDADISNIKPIQSNSAINNSVQKRQLNKEQAQFNKFVREEVSKKFGEDFLLQHEVNQLESATMEMIKNEAIASFLPKDTTPVRAWKLAKVSLRSLKRDLRRKQGIISSKKDSHSNNQTINNINNQAYY